MAIYEDVFEQFKEHNDHVCLQNILRYKEKHLSTVDDVRQIIREMTAIFMEDQKISNTEQHILYLAEKLLK